MALLDAHAQVVAENRVSNALNTSLAYGAP